MVDDGSEDDTQALITKLKKEAPFPVRYKKQQNNGKHVAINHGVILARGAFFIIADSDDEFLPDALQILYDEWMRIDPHQREKFTGITGLCVSADNQIIGNSFPEDVFDSTPAETYYCYGIRGDKAGFHKTVILKKFPFPELEQYKFFAESIIWNRIGREFLTRYINIPVRVFSDAGNQLTNKTLKSALGTGFFIALLWMRIWISF